MKFLSKRSIACFYKRNLEIYKNGFLPKINYLDQDEFTFSG